MRRCRPLLGTYVEIDCDRAAAIEAAFAAVARVHRLMSAHEPASELSRINRLAHREPVQVSGDTAAVLEQALHWSRRSDGAFDVVRAGARALHQRRLPLHRGQPRPDDGSDHSVVQLRGRAVTLDSPGCLDLGGIAKGYAVDLAIAALRHGGASFGLVNAGGDLRAFGPEPHRITVVDPAHRREAFAIELRDAAVATSAGLPASPGLSFDHLPDTRAEWTSVTITAAEACTADCLTKIAWALGPDAAPLLVEVGAEAVAIRADGRLDRVMPQAAAA